MRCSYSVAPTRLRADRRRLGSDRSLAPGIIVGLWPNPAPDPLVFCLRSPLRSEERKPGGLDSTGGCRSIISESKLLATHSILCKETPRHSSCGSRPVEATPQRSLPKIVRCMKDGEENAMPLQNDYF